MSRYQGFTAHSDRKFPHVRGRLRSCGCRVPPHQRCHPVPDRVCRSDPGDCRRGRPGRLSRLCCGKGSRAARKAENAPADPASLAAAAYGTLDLPPAPRPFAVRRRRGEEALAREGDPMGVREVSVRCCIAGGGPAGMMLALLLARAGIAVLVLEKHGDFLRDFRGDTIHPSTLEVMYELGILEEFLQRPHQEVRTLGAQVGDVFLQVADFEHLPTHCRFVALMPQWDFFNFIAEQAKRYPGFQLKMEAEATALIEEGGRVTGLRAETPQGGLTVHADLVVGADGRHSIVREKAGLEITNLGAPMDVLWMRLSRRSGDPGQTLGRVDTGRIFVMLNREDYWQCAYVIPKGGFDQIRQSGLAFFRGEITRLAPYLGDRVGELDDWSDIKLLTVAVDRLG